MCGGRGTEVQMGEVREGDQASSGGLQKTAEGSNEEFKEGLSRRPKFGI